MQLLNKFPWLQTIVQKLYDYAPQLQSLAELEKLSLPEVHWGPNAQLYSKQFYPDRPFNFNRDARPLPEVSGASARRVILSFDSNDCFVNVSKVPATLRKHTLGVLQLQLQKIMPIAANRYIVGWHVLDQTDNMNRIEQFVLKLSVLEEAQTRLSQAGFRLAAIVFRPDCKATIPIALLLDGTEFGELAHRYWIKLLIVVLFAIGLGCWGVGFAKTGWHAQSITKVEDRAAQLLTEVQALKAAQKSDEKKVATLAAARLARNAKYSPSFLLEELAILTPDNTFLTKLSFEGPSVTIEGLSAEPESLVVVFEQSTILSNVSFTAPVFKNPGETQSRFSIKMTVEKAALP
jgi:Tfp pilus assembly protein PilN